MGQVWKSQFVLLAGRGGGLLYGCYCVGFGQKVGR